MARVPFLLSLLAAASASPLWDYVHKDDGAFAWTDTAAVISSGPNSTSGWKGYVLNMTSQTWLTPADFQG